MVKIKICGITNLEDAETAAALGADALGFVFAKSPRQIDLSTAQSIIRNLKKKCIESRRICKRIA